MHRDIKPENLGVLSFGPPRGGILNLDAATTDETSDDHMQGTIFYLAHEIISLKMVSTSTSETYGRSVDIWGLGVSALFAVRRQLVNWNDFNDNFTVGRHLPSNDDYQFCPEGHAEEIPQSC